ncbi:TPA: DUF5659 domain-containing protein [Clostridium perfringens]
MQTKVIFSKRIALELISRGYNLLYTEPNRAKKWLVVFVFEETDELLEELTNLTK